MISRDHPNFKLHKNVSGGIVNRLSGVLKIQKSFDPYGIQHKTSKAPIFRKKEFASICLQEIDISEKLFRHTEGEKD